LTNNDLSDVSGEAISMLVKKNQGLMNVKIG